MVPKALLPLDRERQAIRIIEIDGLTRAYPNDVDVLCAP